MQFCSMEQMHMEHISQRDKYNYAVLKCVVLCLIVLNCVSLPQAHISFCPTMDQQRKCPGCDGTLIDGDFLIKYDVNRAEALGDIQVSCVEYDTGSVLGSIPSIHGVHVLMMFSMSFSDSEWVLCALLCASGLTPSSKKCGVCDR